MNLYHVDELLAEASRYRQRRNTVCFNAMTRYGCTFDRAMRIAHRYMRIFGEERQDAD